MLKVYIKGDHLGMERPIVLAHYRADISLPDDAHGPGVTVMMLPDNAVGGPSTESLGMHCLVKNWRELAGDMPAKAEAERRINDGFPIVDQLNALFDMVDAITKYGADMARWPADVRQRKNTYDTNYKYVKDVLEKVKTHSAIPPRDFATDKIWPQRLKKHV